MTNKEAFIKIIQREIFDNADVYAENYDEDLAFMKAEKFWSDFLAKEQEKPMPEKSTALLTFMQENKEKYNNLFTSAAIATEMGISGKSVGGSMRSLVSKGYVTKLAGTPVVYQLTN